jgi:outer membrane protein TolC
MRWIALTTLTLAAVAPGLQAQELSLEEAVAIALENNPAVQAARSRAEAADARARQARGHRFGELDLSEVYSYTDNPAEVFAFKLNQERFSFDDFVAGDPNEPDFLTNWMTRLELTLPIYTGGELGARIDQAEFAASAAELRAGHSRQRVAFDTISAFVDLAKAREQVALMKTSRATTLEHLEMAEAYSRQGLILEAEVLKARVFLAEMDELVAQASNGARLAEAALNFHMGLDQRVPRTLAELEPPPAVGGELADVIDRALEQRRDLVAARRELEAGRLEEKAARSAFLPEVGASARYDLYDDTVFGSNGSSGAIMAMAKINLYRGGSDRAAIEAARRDTESFSHDIERFEEGVRLEVEQAWQELETARARLATATKSLAAAREALRVREHRFKQGLDRMIDLLDAETALREAQMREMTARYDVSLISYRLMFVSGASLTASMEESS